MVDFTIIIRGKLRQLTSQFPHDQLTRNTDSRGTKICRYTIAYSTDPIHICDEKKKCGN